MFKLVQFVGVFLLILCFSLSAQTILTEKQLISVKKIVKGVCVACHSVDGNSVITANPKIANQHSAYLAKQLINFKVNIRKNAIMAGMVSNLSSEDISNLSIYFSEQSLVLSKAKENGKGSLGEKIFRSGIKNKGVPACASCHGPAGHGIPDLYPRLNAQHAEYTTAQLNLFRLEERPGLMMQTIAQKLTEKEMIAVSDYIQGLR